ncbi:TPA: hypothetical protein ACGXKU_003995 [Bacillus cereus]
MDFYRGNGYVKRYFTCILYSVYKGAKEMNIKMASSEETCEYCKCLLSDWLFWRWNGKKYCSESCAEYDKK